MVIINKHSDSESVFTSWPRCCRKLISHLQLSPNVFFCHLRLRRAQMIITIWTIVRFDFHACYLSRLLPISSLHKSTNNIKMTWSFNLLAQCSNYSHTGSGTHYTTVTVPFQRSLEVNGWRKCPSEQECTSDRLGNLPVSSEILTSCHVRMAW